jgi:hypothetical protein
MLSLTEVCICLQKRGALSLQHASNADAPNEMRMRPRYISHDTLKFSSFHFRKEILLGYMY